MGYYFICAPTTFVNLAHIVAPSALGEAHGALILGPHNRCYKVSLAGFKVGSSERAVGGQSPPTLLIGIEFATIYLITSRNTPVLYSSKPTER